MDTTILWKQFGASIDMLENAIIACPDDVWNDGTQPEFWYLTYHTLFFLELYLSEGVKGFRPPAPFGLEELDPAGVMPERVHTKDELHRYLLHCRKKCQVVLSTLTDEKANQYFHGFWKDMTIAELLLDTMRHVQHHTAQLNLLLRQKTASAPEYVTRTKKKLNEV
jgi:uncharacterized damage-inducible protein DinB